MLHQDVILGHDTPGKYWFANVRPGYVRFS
jgi:hypothetical protein